MADGEPRALQGGLKNCALMANALPNWNRSVSVSSFGKPFVRLGGPHQLLHWKATTALLPGRRTRTNFPLPSRILSPPIWLTANF